MEFGQLVLTVATIAVMVLTLFLSFIPFVPGPALMWAIATIYAVLTGFQQVTLPGVILITLLMLVSATSDFWLPLLGMKTRGVSCSSVLGTIGGGILGTIFIPIPLMGTLLGAVSGAIVMEVMRVGDVRRALRAGTFAAETFVGSLITEFVVNLSIIAVFVISVAF